MTTESGRQGGTMKMMYTDIIIGTKGTIHRGRWNSRHSDNRTRRWIGKIIWTIGDSRGTIDKVPVPETLSIEEFA